MTAILAKSPLDFTIEKFLSLVDEQQYKAPNKTPLLIIKYGPPGSGKSSADKLISKIVGQDLLNFVHIDKDSPLITIAEFRTRSIEIIKKKQIPFVDQAVFKQVLTLQNEILSAKNKDGLSITDKIPIVLQRCFDYNLNIIWETTGQSTESQKLLDAVFNSVPQIYRILVVFPIISLKTAKKRVISRAFKHLEEDPPYFRPVPLNQLKKATIQSREYFTKKIIPRVLNGQIYQLLCYNNEIIPENGNYKVITDKNVTRRRNKKRLLPSWKFTLDKKGKRVTIKNNRTL